MLRQTDCDSFQPLCSRRAARQRRTRFLVSIVAGTLFSLGALTSLQAASVSSGQLPVKATAPHASARLLSALGVQGMAADGLSYATLSGLATKSPAQDATQAPAKEAEAAESAAASEQVAEADFKEAAMAALEQWAQSWRSRDVTAYLAAYGENFQPANGLGRDEWAKQRRQRIGDKRDIQLDLREIEVEAESAERIRVKFVQDYRADQFVERGTVKLIVLALENNQWRILSEESVR